VLGGGGIDRLDDLGFAGVGRDEGDPQVQGPGLAQAAGALVRGVAELAGGLEAVARAGQLDRSVAEHGQMIDLALAGDRPALEVLVAQHIGHVRTLWAEPASRSGPSALPSDT